MRASVILHYPVQLRIAYAVSRPRFISGRMVLIQQVMEVREMEDIYVAIIASVGGILHYPVQLRIAYAVSPVS